MTCRRDTKQDGEDSSKGALRDKTSIFAQTGPSLLRCFINCWEVSSKLAWYVHSLRSLWLPLSPTPTHNLPWHTGSGTTAARPPRGKVGTFSGGTSGERGGPFLLRGWREKGVPHGRVNPHFLKQIVVRICWDLFACFTLFVGCSLSTWFAIRRYADPGDNSEGTKKHKQTGRICLSSGTTEHYGNSQRISSAALNVIRDDFKGGFLMMIFLRF